MLPNPMDSIRGNSRGGGGAESGDFLLMVTDVRINDATGEIDVDGVTINGGFCYGVRVEPQGGSVYVPAIGQTIRVEKSPTSRDRMVGTMLRSEVSNFVNLGNGDLLLDAENRVIVLAQEFQIRDRKLLEVIHGGGGLNYISDSGFNSNSNWVPTNGDLNTAQWVSEGYLDAGAIKFSFLQPGDTVSVQGQAAWAAVTGNQSLSAHLSGRYTLDAINDPLKAIVELYNKDGSGILTPLTDVVVEYDANSGEATNRSYRGLVDWVRVFKQAIVPEVDLLPESLLAGKLKLEAQGSYNKVINTVAPNASEWKFSSSNPGSSYIAVQGGGHFGFREPLGNGDILDLQLQGISKASCKIGTYTLSFQDGRAMLVNGAGARIGSAISISSNIWMRVQTGDNMTISFGSSRGDNSQGIIASGINVTGEVLLQPSEPLQVAFAGYFEPYELTVDNIQLERGNITGWESTPLEIVGQDIISLIEDAVVGVTINGDKVIIKGDGTGVLDQTLADYFLSGEAGDVMYIDGGFLYANTVTAEKINVTELSALTAKTGTLIAGPDATLFPNSYRVYVGDPNLPLVYNKSLTDTGAPMYLDAAGNLVLSTSVSIGNVPGSRIISNTRNFTSQPVPPYYANDTWTDGTRVWRCTATRTTGSFDADQWELTTNRVFNGSTDPTNYKIGDVWVNAGTTKYAITASASYNDVHWTTAGDGTTSALESGVTINQGGVIVGDGGSIRSYGKTTYNSSTAGWWLGRELVGGVQRYTFGIGNNTNYLRWSGTGLSFSGELVAASGSFSGSLSGGSITSLTSANFGTNVYIGGNLYLQNASGGYKNLYFDTSENHRIVYSSIGLAMVSSKEAMISGGNSSVRCTSEDGIEFTSQGSLISRWYSTAICLGAKIHLGKGTSGSSIWTGSAPSEGDVTTEPLGSILCSTGGSLWTVWRDSVSSKNKWTKIRTFQNS